MGKTLKKVFLPSGLIASMYNLYGGSGDSREALNMYDIQLLCSYLEYYFNYTNPDSKKYVYRFYTLPHFYKANPTDKGELKIESKEDKIKGKHTTKVIDENSSENGTLYKIHELLMANKAKKIGGIIKSGVLQRELDSSFGDNSGLPLTPYELGAILERTGRVQDGNDNKKIGGFRIEDLYKIKRRVKPKENADGGENTSDFVEVPMFDYGIHKELSTFFILNPEYSKGKLSAEEFSENDKEMQEFLQSFFSSGCYKLLEKDKSSQYGPDVDTFLSCFYQAVKAYNKLGFNEMNRKYINQLDAFKANKVNYGAVQE